MRSSPYPPRGATPRGERHAHALLTSPGSTGVRCEGRVSLPWFLSQSETTLSFQHPAMRMARTEDASRHNATARQQANTDLG